MMFELTTPFPNALMYLVLEDDPEVPDIDGLANLWRTESMVAQAVLHDAEGQVHFTVSDSLVPSGSSKKCWIRAVRASRRADVADCGRVAQ